MSTLYSKCSLGREVPHSRAESGVLSMLISQLDFAQRGSRIGSLTGFFEF
jgi:hypothetical protein